MCEKKKESPPMTDLDKDLLVDTPLGYCVTTILDFTLWYCELCSLGCIILSAIPFLEASALKFNPLQNTLFSEQRELK